MEVISIERSTYEELLTSFNSFVSQMKAMAGRETDKRLGEWLDKQDVCQILNIRPRTLQTLRQNGTLAYSQIRHATDNWNIYQSAYFHKSRFITEWREPSDWPASTFSQWGNGSDAINNQIVRERFNLNTKQSVMASRILADTLESGLIKMKNPETESKRYTSYIPYYGWILFSRESAIRQNILNIKHFQFSRESTPYSCLRRTGYWKYFSLSYSLLILCCKTTVFWVIHRYEKWSSLRNKGGTTKLSISGRVPTGGGRCCVLPRFAFILGRIALIFQNPSFVTSFFCIFAADNAKRWLKNVNYVK